MSEALISQIIVRDDTLILYRLYFDSWYRFDVYCSFLHFFAIVDIYKNYFEDPIL